ncbi:MAG: pentapeptide repeat-containing protein [Roseovarius confluentis]|jgi:hypothetical protein
MRIEVDVSDQIAAVEASETNVFSELVELSGLDPSVDFRSSKLNEVDFSGSDLAGFDFSYADLRGANWQGVVADPKDVRFSLRGKGTSQVRGVDFEAIAKSAMHRRLWSERFFAFRLLVDNWGENTDTFEVLRDILGAEEGVYMRQCSFLYFMASYSGDDRIQKLCTQMANAGRSQTNMFRLRDVRKALENYESYFGRVETRKRYPGDVHPRNLIKLYSLARDEFLEDGRRGIL